MARASELVATFLTHAGVRAIPPADEAALGPLLEHIWETARAQWPEVALAPGAFIRYLAERLPEVPPGSALKPVLDQLSLAELYLACACVQGLPEALAAFERHYLARLPEMLRPLRRDAVTIDEICQQARVKLLLGTPEAPPRLQSYSGRGALVSWVRVLALRVALNLAASEKPASDEGVAEVLESLPAPAADVELNLIHQRHREEFRQALREAFAALPERERHLLRLHIADQLSTTELGELFRVNQSTASRWLKSARQTVYEETKLRLQARLGLSTGEFQSFLSVLDSQLDVSMSQIFGEEDG
ncbi:sigma-70 family RNA polymerase sigma factor [Cystobacter fuscus]|uniref:sigma-70 family RNA polymerase sigma factor n=1 Tax=Cystobacter fuscus TaxID=43 RepID=UPI002B2E10F1|nr:sigma-70 family RNA polymerase sigma factor [Cystobacter fuscus]